MKIIIACLLLALCAHAMAADPESKENPASKIKPKFTISKETTYVLGPVDKDGCINYAAALNERLSKGVTVENNANVLIWKASGPLRDGKMMPPEYFRQIGIEPPPEHGEYFIGLSRFLQDKFKMTASQADKYVRKKPLVFERSWIAKDCPEVDEWLKANEKPLLLYVEASKRSRYFYPYGWVTGEKDKTSFVEAVQEYFLFRDMTQALLCRSLLRIGANQFDEAWKDLSAAHRISRLATHNGTLMDTLTGVALNAVVCRSELAFLDRTNYNSAQIQKCLRDLQDLTPIRSIAEDLEEGERIFSLGNIMAPAFGDLYQLQASMRSSGGKILERTKDAPKRNPELMTLLHDVDWDSILRETNRRFDRVAAIMREPLREKREKQFAALAEETKKSAKENQIAAEDLVDELKKLKSDPAAKTKLLKQIICSSNDLSFNEMFQNMRIAADRQEQVQHNLYVAFALAAYRRDHAGYPKTLDELAPKYLAKIPNDLFTEKPLAYSPNEKGYLLYSFGPNGKDDEGRTAADGPQNDDISVRMPLPELRKN